LQKHRAELIGSVHRTYFGFRNVPKIGEGGFGKVYKYRIHPGPELAIKQEIKVLISDYEWNFML